MRLVTNSLMREIDRKAIEEHGVPSILLMERAATALAKKIREIQPAPAEILILCGKGNNGGDGLSLARRLTETGYAVSVLLMCDPDELKGDAKIQYDLLISWDIEALTYDHQTSIALLATADLIVDALFGTGFAGDITGDTADLIHLVNQSHLPVVSADIPSGVNGDTGQAATPSIRANYTVTFGLPKVGLFLPSGNELAGDITVADIGLPPNLMLEIESEYQLVTRELAKAISPKRHKNAHKGDNGRILIIGGSLTMPGAPLIAGYSALRAGAGLVTLAVPETIYHMVAGRYPELMVSPLPDEGTGVLHSSAIPALKSLCAGMDAVILGPGLSLAKETGEALSELIPIISCPMVIDADALNWLSAKPELCQKLANTPRILTPHPGELARMLNKSINEVQADRVGSLIKALENYGGAIILKGNNTITSSQGEKLYFNTTGNPGMATAGMGDALSGIIGALIGQKMKPLPAAILSVYIHGIAGDMAGEDIGHIGFTAIDLADQIPQAREILWRNE